MPELPEVLVMAKALNEKLQGCQLLSIQVDPGSKFYESFPTGLSLPWTCTKVCYRAKRLYFIFKNDRGQRFYLYSFLSMTGRWLFEAKKHSSFHLCFEDCTVSYDDSRRFGDLALFSKSELEAKLDELGYDWYLDRNILTPEFLYYEMKEPKRGKWQLVKFLLDYKITSGIGNYIKSEAIYLANLACRQAITPDMLLSELSWKQIQALYHAIIRVIDESIEAGGFTQKDYLHPDGRKGSYQPYIYGLTVTAEGHKVKKEKFTDGRATFFV